MENHTALYINYVISILSFSIRYVVLNAYYIFVMNQEAKQRIAYLIAHVDANETKNKTLLSF